LKDWVLFGHLDIGYLYFNMNKDITKSLLFLIIPISLLVILKVVDNQSGFFTQFAGKIYSTLLP
jgi:hypothetical protein